MQPLNSQSKTQLPLVGSVRLIHEKQVVIQSIFGRVKAKVPDGFIWELQVGDQILAIQDQQQYWVIQLLRKATKKGLVMQTDEDLSIQSKSLKITTEKCTTQTKERFDYIKETDYLEANNRIEKIESIHSTESEIDIKQAKEVAVTADKILFNC